MDAIRETEAARDTAIGRVAKLEIQRDAIISGVVTTINSQLALMSRLITFLMLILILVSILQYFTGWWGNSAAWRDLLDIVGLLGAYHLVTALLGKPMLNLSRALDLLAPYLIERRLDQLNLLHISADDFEYKSGTIQRK